MVNELFLYSKENGLFKTILEESAVFQGRYHLSPNYGHDLNANNLDSYLKDPAYGMTAPSQKYPLVVCITPTSRTFSVNGQEWEEFFFSLYFLQRTFLDGKNQVKRPDKDTGRSSRSVEEDWQEMKNSALQFKNVLKGALRKNLVIDARTVPLTSVIRLDEESRITRITKYNNDNISGVGIVFKISIFAGLCELTEYESTVVTDLEINWLNSGI